MEAAAAPGGVVAPAVAAPYACCKMNLSRSGVANASRPTSGDASTLPSRTTSCFGLLLADCVGVLADAKSSVKLVFFRRSSSELSAEGRAARSIVYSLVRPYDDSQRRYTSTATSTNCSETFVPSVLYVERQRTSPIVRYDIINTALYSVVVNTLTSVTCAIGICHAQQARSL